MKRQIIGTTVASILLCICFSVIFRKSNADTAFSLAITFGTISYHFLMRLIVGHAIGGLMKNRADYTKKWYQCSKWEQALYKRLNVKKWKRYMPTYAPDYFDPKKHTWCEIAQAMCQAEVVHEFIIPLSFIPIAFSIWFGALPVFIITSVFAAALDLIFVIMQRYNRARIVKLIR